MREEPTVFLTQAIFQKPESYLSFLINKQVILRIAFCYMANFGTKELLKQELAQVEA